MPSIVVDSKNIRQFDNYVLYRIWNEATTKKERSLAMKEIKRRQAEGNMVSSRKVNRKTSIKLRSNGYYQVRDADTDMYIGYYKTKADAEKVANHYKKFGQVLNSVDGRVI